MTSAFDSQFKQSGFPQLKDTFGEPVTYYFRAGGERCITAIINRNPPAFYDASGNVVLPEFTVRFDNDCVTGVLSSKIDNGGDEVKLLAQVGDIIPVRKTVLQIISQNSGVVVVAVK